MLGGLTLKIEEAEPTCSNLPVFLGNIAVTLLLVEIKLKVGKFLLLIFNVLCDPKHASETL